LGAFEKSLGPDHPNVKTSRDNLAKLYEAMELAKADDEADKPVTLSRASQQ
jgi:hypothetical protein